jgi:hypothetical protein
MPRTVSLRQVPIPLASNDRRFGAMKHQSKALQRDLTSGLPRSLGKPSPNRMPVNERFQEGGHLDVWPLRF